MPQRRKMGDGRREKGEGRRGRGLLGWTGDREEGGCGWISSTISGVGIGGAEIGE
jgi:hypothetical protein